MAQGKKSTASSDKENKKMTLEEKFTLLNELYHKKGVDFDTHGLFLSPYGKVFYLVCGSCDDDDNAVDFTKKKPVAEKDFCMEDYPLKVQKILKRYVDNVDGSNRMFPNCIETGVGKTFAEAIDDMMEKAVLLNYGWSLFSTPNEYYSEHANFFGEDEDEDEDFDINEDEDFDINEDPTKLFKD